MPVPTNGVVDGAGCPVLECVGVEGTVECSGLCGVKVPSAVTQRVALCAQFFDQFPFLDLAFRAAEFRQWSELECDGVFPRCVLPGA